MGTINCCVDVSAVDTLALSNRSPAATPASADSITLVSGVSSQAQDQCQEKLLKEERSRTPSHTISPRPTQQTQSIVAADQSLQLKRKIPQTRRTQSLPSGGVQRDVWVNAYLCPCNQCPNSQSADRILDWFYRVPMDNTDEYPDSALRSTLHRVLRACATFDERRELDVEVAQQIYELVATRGADEDVAFRKVVALRGHAVRPVHQLGVTSAIKRRSSAVTA